jgi:signal transduction histidine kinase/PAS domain-containing protein
MGAVSALRAVGLLRSLAPLACAVVVFSETASAAISAGFLIPPPRQATGNALRGPGRSQASAPASVKSRGQTKTVLILVPGQPTGTQTGIDAFTGNTRRTLLDILPAGSSVYVEYTDLARRQAADQQNGLRAWYAAKYAGVLLDLLIAGSEEPRAFLTRNRSILWPRVPIIFAGMDERSLEGVTLPEGSTAFTMRFDEEGTVRAALALLPDTERAALVTGTSDLDRYRGKLWREALGHFGDRLQLIDLGGLPLEDLRSRLAGLPPHTVVLFSTLYTDGTGRSFVNTEVLPGLVAVSNRPMFTIHGSFLGLGVVGGVLTDYAALGRQTGKVAARVLRGAPLPASPVRALGVNQPLFDWRELHRWGISERLLPPGSIVRYRPPSAWELYRWPIVIGLSVLVAQGLLIAGLLVQRAGRQRARHMLDEQLRFERFLAGLSRSFVDAPADRIDREIPRGLRQIGEFFGLDRVSLVELERLEGRAHITYTWSAEGTERLPAEMPAPSFPWIAARIARGEVVTFSDRDSLPSEAEADRGSFAAYGTRSHASIPLVKSGAARRVLALSTVRARMTWPEPMMERFRLVAEILGEILARKYAELEVEESRSLQQAMLSSLPSPMAVLDSAGRILTVNQAWLDHADEPGASSPARLSVGANYLDVCREARLSGEPGAREALDSVECVLAGQREISEIEFAAKHHASERWLRLSAMALRGRRGGAVVAYTDVTDHVLAREQLRQFSGHLIAAQEEERRRIARELHDDLNQRLVLLALEISQAKSGGGARERAGYASRQVAERLGEIAADVHRLAYQLHPFKLDYLGLAGAAQAFCGEIGAAHGITIAFAARDVPRELPREVTVCAYRVLQEALTNVVKHSGSARAEVELYSEDARLVLVVRDFGLGMSPDVMSGTPGLGLGSMRERLRLVDGLLTVDSSPEAGTRLEVRIPLPAPARIP